MVRQSFKAGLSFGITSGIITTLGLIVGFHSGFHSKLPIIGGILIIAIADAFSDSLGIHISEESEKHSSRYVWESTFGTFFAKLVFASTFILPILLFELSLAIIISIIWGLAALCVLSFFVAKERKARPWKVVLEHLAIALVVIIVTHYIGDWLALTFG